MASDGHPPGSGKEEAATTASGPGARDLDDPQFMCCVCLDILYKPVVIACGHMSCFWCVNKAMHIFQESHCAVCRQPFKHFPSICQLMHHLLLKLDPAEYKRREAEVLEEEKRIETYSPQIIEFLNSKNNVGSDVDNINEDSKTRPPQEVSLNGSVVDDHSKKIKLEDVSCPLCKEMLYQPAVLNCGHVYCVSCLPSSNEEALKCDVCGSLHPGSFPNVCLDLDHFLEEYFPVEYQSRGEKVQSKKGQCNREASSSGTSSAKGSSRAHHDDGLSDVHVGVGCDSCGEYPIHGKRYKCRDCTELIGFDLCGPCYESSLKLPGRFNQQHTPDHRMELDNSTLLRRLHQDLLMMEGGVIVPGAMVQIVFEHQGMGEDLGEAAVGAPGAVLHMAAVDDGIGGDLGEAAVGAPGAVHMAAVDDQEMEDNGQEDDQEA